MLRVDSNVVTYKQQAFYLTSAKLSANTLLPSLGDDSNHMTKSIKWHSAALSALFLMLAGSALLGLSLTGNVETDFDAPGAVMVTDGPMPDVGLPQQFGSAVTSGWDIKDFRFFYDAEEDALYVGINFFGIAGDADGDGNPSVTTQELLALGGQDLANLASSEAIQIQFDWNGDEEFDTIAGVPTDANADAFSVAPESSPAGEFPAKADRFIPPIPEIERFIGALNATAPDFEFKIPKVSTLPGFDAAGGFGFRAFAGSFNDDGIGEDRSGDLVHVDLPTPAPPVVSLTELIVSRSYFNFWGTAAGEGGIARVEYKTDQRHWTRFVPANGTTSWKFKVRRDSYHSLRAVIRAINNEGDASPEMVIEVQP